MAIAHRASAVANSTTNTTSLTVTIPASIQTGDLLFLAFINRGAADAPSITDDDSGGNTWATVRAGVNPGYGGVVWKRATSGTASKTVTVSGCTDSCSAVLSGFSGGKTTDPPYENDTAENHASGTETRTGFTPSVDGSMICLAILNTANDNAVSTQSSTNPGALTELAEHLNTGGLDCASNIAAAIQTTAAATGSLTWAQTDGTTISVGWNILPTQGAISGASTITFSTAGVLGGSGALLGTSTITFATAGALVGAGSLLGTATVTFTNAGNLIGSAAVSGSTSLTFTATAIGGGSASWIWVNADGLTIVFGSKEGATFPSIISPHSTDAPPGKLRYDQPNPFKYRRMK